MYSSTEALLFFPIAAAISNGILAVASFAYVSQLRSLAWVGLTVCLLEMPGFIHVFAHPQ
jgi:hypothetical protein